MIFPLKIGAETPIYITSGTPSKQHRQFLQNNKCVRHDGPQLPNQQL
jgi:hypothetical protein